MPLLPDFNVSDFSLDAITENDHFLTICGHRRKTSYTLSLKDSERLSFEVVVALDLWSSDCQTPPAWVGTWAHTLEVSDLFQLPL